MKHKLLLKLNFEESIYNYFYFAETGFYKIYALFYVWQLCTCCLFLGVPSNDLENPVLRTNCSQDLGTQEAWY